MEKSFKIIMALVFGMFLFSSCQKEGQYLPKKKITKIENFSTTSGITINLGSQEWEWDGKLLNKITSKDGNGEIKSIATFKYGSNKRIEWLHVDNTPLISDYEYIYEGKDLVKIIRHNATYDDDVVTFKKMDGKVVEITLSPIASKDFSESGVNPLDFVLTKEVASHIKPLDTKAVTVYKLTWDGKNIVAMDLFSNGVLSMKNTWKYDEMINPYKGLYEESVPFVPENLFSANNVIEETTETPVVNYSSKVEFKYEYDGKYPVKRTWTTSTLGIITESSEIIYYK